MTHGPSWVYQKQSSADYHGQGDVMEDVRTEIGIDTSGLASASLLHSVVADLVAGSAG